MVQDLERTRPNPLQTTTLFPATDLTTTNPVLAESHPQYSNQSVAVISNDSLCKLNDRLNSKVRQIQRCAYKLSQIDHRTEDITRPLEYYFCGVVFEPLGDKSLKVNDPNRTLSLNVEVITCLTHTVPKKLIHEAILVFLCHEVSHISQRLGSYEDVQRMKEVDLEAGRQRMREFDLRSDFLAVHTLSLFYNIKQYGVYNTEGYIHWLHHLWNKACREMLGVFPIDRRKDKLQRVFGYLLMSNLIADAHLGHYPLEFRAELCPDWSSQLDILSICSNGYPLVPSSKVDPELMQKILDDISTGSYDSASSGIRDIYKHLPRR